VSTVNSTLQVAPSTLDMPERTAETKTELKRGMFFNTLALLASNFRGVFTFLVAWMLGPAALGIFSVAWATTDLISKIGISGLDNTVITFIARSEAAGDRLRSRSLFRLAVLLGVVQCIIVAAISIIIIREAGGRFGLNQQMIAALSVMLCAMPGLALYRISTSASRGMKVMKHDIFSRGTTEPIATALAFLFAMMVGSRAFAPEIAAIVGTAASGTVALFLAASLFSPGDDRSAEFSYRTEARRLLTFAVPIGAYDFLNAIIVRLDVVMLGCFIGRAPGVTLTTVGVYGAVVEVASGLRKVNQAINPIFAPVVAHMTAKSEQELAAATYSRLAQWMLWILLPLVAVMVLAGAIILMIYGPAFRQGGVWLGIVGAACATNAFVSLGETVIMVQRPRLNLINSSVTCVIAIAANLLLIPRFGVTGAAIGILLPYIVQGILRHAALRWVFRWRNPWRQIAPPVVATAIALVPAVTCRVLLQGMTAQLTAAAVFLGIYGIQLGYHFRTRNPVG